MGSIYRRLQLVPDVWTKEHDQVLIDTGLMDEPARCVVCGEFIDYCQGHGQSGDPNGFTVLWLHDMGVHTHCHWDACDEAPPMDHNCCTHGLSDFIDLMSAVNRDGEL